MHQQFVVQAEDDLAAERCNRSPDGERPRLEELRRRTLDDGIAGEWSQPGAASAPRALPLLQGGKQPGRLAAYRRAIGSDDYLLNVASWLDVHQDGVETAARAFRAAIDTQA